MVEDPGPTTLSVAVPVPTIVPSPTQRSAVTVMGLLIFQVPLEITRFGIGSEVSAVTVPPKMLNGPLR